jgi:hypothetical protein
MITDTSAVVLFRLLLVILGSVVLIIVAARRQLLGHLAIDALVGGIIAAALVAVYPPPAAAPLFAGILWLAASSLAHALARFKQHRDDAAPAHSYSFDVDTLADLFDFEEVP